MYNFLKEDCCEAAHGSFPRASSISSNNFSEFVIMHITGNILSIAICRQIEPC